MSLANNTAVTAAPEDLKWFEGVQKKAKSHLSAGGLRGFLEGEMERAIKGDSAWRVAALLDNAFRGRRASVEVQLTAGGKLNGAHNSALDLAAWSGARESVKVLFDRMPAEPPLFIEGDQFTDISIGSALIKLVHDGDADLLAHALRSNAYKDLGKSNDVVVEIRDFIFKSGKTDLVKAAAQAHPAFLDPAIKRWASHNDHLFGAMEPTISLPVFDTVLELRGPSLTAQQYRELLEAAVSKKSAVAALRIIKAGAAAFDLVADPSPLLYAIEKNEPEVVKALIGDQAGAARLWQSASKFLAFAVDKGAGKAIPVMLDLLPLDEDDVRAAYAQSLRLSPVPSLLSDFLASGKAGHAGPQRAGIAAAAAASSVKKAVPAPEPAAFMKRAKNTP